jgi:iron transport multicopper oxidase
MVPLAVLVLSLSAFTSAALKRFVLDINYTLASPDGYEQRMILANGQIDYPIVADARDDLEITVINNLDVPTSLHWHGIFQKGTPWFDGAAGVTQCPIQPGGKS